MSPQVKCFFCLGEIEKEHHSDQHHVIPKRYGGKVKVTVHRVCHNKWNREFDHKAMNREEFLIYLVAIKQGAGIYKDS